MRNWKKNRFSVPLFVVPEMRFVFSDSFPFVAGGLEPHFLVVQFRDYLSSYSKWFALFRVSVTLIKLRRFRVFHHSGRENYPPLSPKYLGTYIKIRGLFGFSVTLFKISITLFKMVSILQVIHQSTFEITFQKRGCPLLGQPLNCKAANIPSLLS